MSALHDLQARFRDAVLSGETGALTNDIRTEGPRLSRRLGIYRNNVFSNQREALRTIYPVIERLVGREFFKHLADEYLRRHGSPAGDLNGLGEHLAGFLAAFPGADSLVYLPDTARLEWLVHKVYHAPERAGRAIARLAAVPDDRYEDLRFYLHPARALFASSYPVDRIWRVNQAGQGQIDDETSHVHLDSGGVCLLVARRELHVTLRAVEAGEWAFLQSIAAAHPFGEACNAAFELDPAFDINAVLARLINESTLVDVDWSALTHSTN